MAFLSWVGPCNFKSDSHTDSAVRWARLNEQIKVAIMRTIWQLQFASSWLLFNSKRWKNCHSIAANQNKRNSDRSTDRIWNAINPISFAQIKQSSEIKLKLPNKNLSKKSWINYHWNKTRTCRPSNSFKFIRHLIRFTISPMHCLLVWLVFFFCSEFSQHDISFSALNMINKQSTEPNKLIGCQQTLLPRRDSDSKAKLSGWVWACTLCVRGTLVAVVQNIFFSHSFLCHAICFSRRAYFSVLFNSHINPGATITNHVNGETGPFDIN